MATRVKREKKFFRDCPQCGVQIGHVSAKSRDRTEAKGCLCRSCSKKGIPLSEELKAKISASLKGVPSAHYKSVREACSNLYGEKIDYPNNYFVKWGNAVKDRDNYTCLRCNTVATGNYISAHHVVPKAFFPETALDLSNGVTLCNSCHKQIHAFLDKLTLSGVKLDAEGFQTHTIRFINGNKATDVPTEYKPVFSPSVTITTE